MTRKKGKKGEKSGKDKETQKKSKMKFFLGCEARGRKSDEILKGLQYVCIRGDMGRNLPDKDRRERKRVTPTH